MVNRLTDEPYLTQEQMNIIINSQRLWLQLAFAIRSLLFSVLRDPDRTQASANQLFNIVAVRFYDYFRLYYGIEVAQTVVNLLSAFITNMWRLFMGISANDSEMVNSSTAEIYRIADETASYLSSINLYWDENQWKEFLYQMIQTSIEQTLSLARQDFDREYRLFSRITDLAALTGNYMARGIIARSAVQTPLINM